MVKTPKLRSPTGMHDILPADQSFFQKVYTTASSIANFYGFEKIDTPLVEDAELFVKSIGMSTDIIEKQMYVFRSKGVDLLALRPEFPAGIARAYIEHGMFNLPQPLKFYSFGPLFGLERPQAGRFRQFHQIDFEVFGEQSPVIDAQIIQIFYNLLRELKFKNLMVEINSIGDRQCRPYYKKLLVNYFRSRENSLCADCRRRLRYNPLRILDYNTKTVFEMFDGSEEGQKGDALVGGGRFDALVRLLGGRNTPACGAAAGVERSIQVLKERSKKESAPPVQVKDVF